MTAETSGEEPLCVLIPGRERIRRAFRNAHCVGAAGGKASRRRNQPVELRQAVLYIRSLKPLAEGAASERAFRKEYK